MTCLRLLRKVEKQRGGLRKMGNMTKLNLEKERCHRYSCLKSCWKSQFSNTRSLIPGVQTLHLKGVQMFSCAHVFNTVLPVLLSKMAVDKLSLVM